jgi:hypothetical protein
VEPNIANKDDDSPLAIAKRLTKYVNELLAARQRRSADAIRGRTQLILIALEKLRVEYAKSPFDPDLVRQIQRDKERARLELPPTSADYHNYCWDCNAHGKQTLVDQRVDSVCNSCKWVQCPECGACRDPLHGGCPDRVRRDRKR